METISGAGSPPRFSESPSRFTASPSARAQTQAAPVAVFSSSRTMGNHGSQTLLPTCSVTTSANWSAINPDSPSASENTMR